MLIMQGKGSQKKKYLEICLTCLEAESVEVNLKAFNNIISCIVAERDSPLSSQWTFIKSSGSKLKFEIF